MKYVYVYYQHDFEDFDVYIRGVYSKEEDAVRQMDDDIKEFAKLYHYNYATARDSFDMPFRQAASSFTFYMSAQCEWKISIEALDDLEG